MHFASVLLVFIDRIRLVVSAKSSFFRWKMSLEIIFSGREGVNARVSDPALNDLNS